MRQSYLLSFLNPILVLKLRSFCSFSTIETALQIIDFLNRKSILLVDSTEDIFHADKVDGVNFLFIDVDFEFVEAVGAYDESVGIINRMLIVIFKNIHEESEICFGDGF